MARPRIWSPVGYGSTQTDALLPAISELVAPVVARTTATDHVSFTIGFIMSVSRWRRRARRTPAFTCKARLNACSRSEHTSAPCLVQGFVVRRLHLSRLAKTRRSVFAEAPAFSRADDPSSLTASQSPPRSVRSGRTERHSLATATCRGV